MKYLFENLHKIGFYTSFVEILDVVILHGYREILMKAIQIFFAGQSQLGECFDFIVMDSDKSFSMGELLFSKIEKLF